MKTATVLVAVLAAAALCVTPAVARHHKPIAPSTGGQVDANGSVSIRGIVRKGAKPVANVRVWLAHHKVGPARTDDKGHFEFSGLRAGTYTLFAGPHARGTSHTKTHVKPGHTASVVIAMRGPRPWHWHRGHTVGPTL